MKEKEEKIKVEPLKVTSNVTNSDKISKVKKGTDGGFTWVGDTKSELVALVIIVISLILINTSS